VVIVRRREGGREGGRAKVRTEASVLLGQTSFQLIAAGAEIASDGVEHGQDAVADPVDDEVDQDGRGALREGGREGECGVRAQLLTPLMMK
jgi:hypothetical protein